VCVVVALVGLVVARSGDIDALTAPGNDDPDWEERFVALIGAGVALMFGVAAVRSLGTAVKRVTAVYGEEARASSLVFLISLMGYMFVILAVLSALKRPLDGLLFGGAVTGVVLGIAAQQTLGNVFAGIVLLIVRPFTVGEHITLKSGPIGGEYEGRVTEMSMFYVQLETERGPVALPNAGVLASAVGPGAHTASDEEEPAEEEPTPGPAHGGPPNP
jgi:small-conductance mechanosensitive channel